MKLIDRLLQAVGLRRAQPLRSMTEADFNEALGALPQAWPRVPRVTLPRIPPALVARRPAPFIVDLDDVPERDSGFRSYGGSE